MNHGKRIGLLGIVAACALALAACGGPTSGGTSSGGAEQPKSGPYKIGFSVFFQGNSFQAQDAKLFKQACKDAGPKVVKECEIQNANGSTSQQIAQIQGMINQDYDAILLDANSATGLNNVVKKALNAGIKVINFDTLITGPATSKINTNQLKWGEVTGKWLVDQLNGKGNIIVLNGVAGNPTGKMRYQKAKELFEKTPGIKILGEANADWDQAKAQVAVSQMLNAYPKIDGVWSQGGAMTAGAMIEFQKAHRPLVPMTGEAYNGFLKLWIDNKANGFTSIAPGQPNYLVTISFDAALRALRGKSVPKKVDVPLPVITDETVSDYYKPDKSDSYWVLNSLPQSKIDALLGAG